MSIELVSFVQEPCRESPEWKTVQAIATDLLVALNAEATYQRIVDANRPGTSSSQVQEAFRAAAEGLGFRTEQKGLFADSITGLRPDYFLPLDTTGILLEVERGKTTTKHMDLLDFWKCHICGVASYLFLLVPQTLKHNEAMSPKKEFASVQRRLAPFFLPGNYTNVRGLCLFGY